MSVRRMKSALAFSCALVTVESASAQDRGTVGPRDPAQVRIVPGVSAEPRIPVVAEARRAAITSLRSWSFGEDAELSLGRFRVIDQARRRTGLERERAPLQMEMETRPIAGAGFRVRF